MSRDITTELAAALGTGELRPAIFFEGEFPSGMVRIWTGPTGLCCTNGVKGRLPLSPDGLILRTQ